MTILTVYLIIELTTISMTLTGEVDEQICSAILQLLSGVCVIDYHPKTYLTSWKWYCGEDIKSV